jgi:citrate lyase subunit beta / citryl-CoA lyase
MVLFSLIFINGQKMNAEIKNNLFRTLLFAPANHPRRVTKALSLGADAVILDLEDAVANSEKVSARQDAISAIKSGSRSKIYVRINALDTQWTLGDLQAVVDPGLHGVVLPKVQGLEDIETVDWLLANLERERGLNIGSIDLLPIIETAKGFNNLNKIFIDHCYRSSNQYQRVKRFTFGAGDFCNDVSMLWTSNERELDVVRNACIVTARAANLEAPIDTVWIHLKDHEGLEKSVIRSLNLGFQGRLCIHPDQVNITNRVFTPTSDEVLRAQKIVDSFFEAEKKGLAAIQVDGMFVDYPILYKAQKILAIHQATSTNSS